MLELRRIVANLNNRSCQLADKWGEGATMTEAMPFCGWSSSVNALVDSYDSQEFSMEFSAGFFLAPLYSNVHSW